MTYSPWIMVLAVCVAAGGCAVTQTGNPQFNPEMLDVRFDCPMGCIVSMFTLTGGAQSVSPAEGQIRVWDLASDRPAVTADVQADGSWLASTDAEHVFVDVAAGSARSEGVQLRLIENTATVEHAPSCLSVEPAGPLPTPGSVAITNDCMETAVVSLRVGSLGEMGDVAAGEQRTFALAEAGNDDLLLVHVGAELHATTVFMP